MKLCTITQFSAYPSPFKHVSLFALPEALKSYYCSLTFRALFMNNHMVVHTVLATVLQLSFSTMSGSDPETFWNIHLLAGQKVLPLKSHQLTVFLFESSWDLECWVSSTARAFDFIANPLAYSFCQASSCSCFSINLDNLSPNFFLDNEINLSMIMHLRSLSDKNFFLSFLS